MNFHFILEQPGIIQVLKDEIPKWKATGHKIFMVCNNRKIPVELNQDIVFMEWLLPDKSVLEDRLDYVLSNALEAGLRIDVDESYKQKLVESALGLSSAQAENAFSLSVIQKGDLDPVVISEFKAQAYLKSGILELEFPRSMDNFKGYDALQTYIKGIAANFHNPSQYKLPSPRGILLVGLPGTGKTMASKCIASALNTVLLKVDLGKVMDQYVGGSERNIRSLLAIAERMAPVVLRIDEIEKQMGGMGTTGNLDSGVGSRVFGTILSWMQDHTSLVYLVATANNIDMLRPELLRKGRFDEIFFIGLPNAKERLEILLYHLESRVSLTSIICNDITPEWLEKIIPCIEGWSGSEIEQLVVSSLRKYESWQRLTCTNNGIEDDPGLLPCYLIEEVENTVPLSILKKGDIERITIWAKESKIRNASERRTIPSKANRVMNFRRE